MSYKEPHRGPHNHEPLRSRRIPDSGGEIEAATVKQIGAIARRQFPDNDTAGHIVMTMVITIIEYLNTAVVLEAWLREASPVEPDVFTGLLFPAADLGNPVRIH
jgi:hypothetical protein